MFQVLSTLAVFMHVGPWTWSPPCLRNPEEIRSSAHTSKERPWRAAFPSSQFAQPRSKRGSIYSSQLLICWKKVINSTWSSKGGKWTLLKEATARLKYVRQRFYFPLSGALDSIPAVWEAARLRAFTGLALNFMGWCPSAPDFPCISLLGSFT